ncbi:MAG: TetR/AcrR family transcriptional repressor of nem operon [Crocinitomix sp.]|jgi:TetR/AcrR family transcriptional repressor of nem operon
MGYKHNIEEILDIGAELIRTNGYHNVGINQILKACAIPKGSFYIFFETKEHFAREILNRYGERSKRMIEGFLLDETVSPLERLKAFYKMLIDGNETEDYTGGCLVNNLSNEVGRLNDGIAESANTNFMMWIEVIAKCVSEGQEKGEITTAFPPEYITEYLHAGSYGAFSRMKVTRTREYLDNWYEMTFNFISE